MPGGNQERELCSAIALVIFSIFGVSVERTIDARESIKDLIR
jgi:hypothetical protein